MANSGFGHRMTLTPVNYGHYRVLVIDDQLFVRRAMQLLLARIGFTAIDEAEDGDSGLFQCIRASPHLIICDIDMRPTSGMEFLARLRAGESGLDRTTPVIFLSNHSDPTIVRQAQALGVDGFLIKPPSIAMLRDRVDRLLSRR